MVGLDAARRRQLKEYSKGMTRRIGLAQALINDPDLVLLDEPTSGLDPIGTREMKDLILRLKEQGKTVVMCSHQLADVQDVCDRIAILYAGELKLLGKVRVLSAEGRMSGWVLGILPFAVAGIINLLNPKFMSVLWTDPMGLKLIYTALGMMLIAAFWMRKIIKIRV